MKARMLLIQILIKVMVVTLASHPRSTRPQMTQNDQWHTSRPPAITEMNHLDVTWRGNRQMHKSLWNLRRNRPNQPSCLHQVRFSTHSLRFSYLTPRMATMNSMDHHVSFDKNETYLDDNVVKDIYIYISFLRHPGTDPSNASLQARRHHWWIQPNLCAKEDWTALW